MTCYHCSEDISLFKIFRFWLWSKVPYNIHMRLDAQQERKQLRMLKKSWELNLSLTARELIVCNSRIEGKTFKEIAKEMNLSQERIRQIQAKAIRKLRKKNNEL